MKTLLKSLESYKEWNVIQSRTSLSKRALVFKTTPRIFQRIYYKEYPRFETIVLVEPLSISISLEEALVGRKSRRLFRKNRPTFKELSTLIYFASGVNPKRLKEKKEFRFYPSAGARFPLEIYIISNKHTYLNSSLYHYNICRHRLEILPYVHQNPISYIGEANKQIATASMYIIITAVFNRTTLKYSKRGYRFVLLEAGHIMQNLYLIAEGLGLHICAIGGFIDKEINMILDLEQYKEQTIYIAAIG